MSNLNILFCSVVIFSGVNAAKLPSYIKPCPLRSSEFSKCAVDNGNAAIPFIINGDKKFGIPNLNPLVLPLIELSTGGLKLNATEVKVIGIPNVYMNDMTIDAEKGKVVINLTNPYLHLEYNYNIGGKIITIAVEGQGTGNITILDCVFIYTFDIHIDEKDGKHYAVIDKDDLDMNPRYFQIHLNNLFNGNKLLGDNVNKFANENWREILTEVRPAVAEVIGSVIRKTVLNIFRIIPLEIVFTDY